MKKFAIAAITAAAVTFSLSNVAEAHHRHHHDDWGHHRCTVIKIIKKVHGNTIIKIIKKCR